MTHTEERLQDRNIRLTPSQIMGYVYEYGDLAQHVAVIIGRVDFQGDSSVAYRNRHESNGDLIVLIIRKGQDKTIMFRRSNQNNTPEGLRVNRLVDLTQ